MGKKTLSMPLLEPYFSAMSGRSEPFQQSTYLISTTGNKFLFLVCNIYIEKA
jgi:hypothetical protein